MLWAPSYSRMRSRSPDKSFPSVAVAPPLRYDPAAVADDTAPDAGVAPPASQGIHDEYIGSGNARECRVGDQCVFRVLDVKMDGADERIRTTDCPLTRRNFSVARCSWLMPNMLTSCTDRSAESRGVASCLSSLAPRLAPLNRAELQGGYTHVPGRLGRERCPRFLCRRTPGVGHWA